MHTLLQNAQTVLFLLTSHCSKRTVMQKKCMDRAVFDQLFHLFYSELSVGVMKIVDMNAIFHLPLVWLHLDIYNLGYDQNTAPRTTHTVCFFSYSFFLFFFNFSAPTLTKCSHFLVTCPKIKNQSICIKITKFYWS
jgi:hypothetical protein